MFKDGAYQYRGIFAQFMKGRSKQGLLESKKKIGGNHTFLEIIKKQ